MHQFIVFANPPQAHIGDLKLHLYNSHLESTAEFASERVAQLKLAFGKVKDSPAEVTTIFAGDLNLRDKEVREDLVLSCPVALWFISLLSRIVCAIP